MSGETLQWYVVHTHAHQEEKARRNLARQEFETFLPRYLKRRRHARRTDWVPAPLFPRYLFVAMDVAFSRWRAISSTIGVSHLVCQGSAPRPVPNDIIDEIRARMNEKGLVLVEAPPPFAKGEVLKVTGGPLADSFGLFDCTTDEDRVILLLDLMGRRVAVTLPLESVAPIA